MYNITASATYKKGVIAKISLDTASADVTVVGSNQNVLKNIPFSSAIDLNDITVGDKCRIDMFDESNPSDSVIAYTYGRKKRGVISSINASIEVYGISQNKLDITAPGVFYSGRTLVETINGGIGAIDQSSLNVRGTGVFFSGRTIAQEINTGSTNIEQRRLAVFGNDKFANGLDIIATINAATADIDGGKIAGVLTDVTEIKRTNTLQTFAAGGTSFYQAILAGSTINIGSSGARFLTAYVSTIDSNNYIANGFSGVTGSFTTSGIFTITVKQGIITSIL
jgi:hypothetical protein